MAVTKILARKGDVGTAISYVVNGDKTRDRALTATQLCTVDTAETDMENTKRRWGQTTGVQYYHIIQSFAPGEVTPELALEIAKAFAAEHLPGYEAVIAVHTDRDHIHAHIIFNSVNADTGEKYHSNAKSYYGQLRATSDRLCREHGLSVIPEGGPGGVSYVEWLRRSRGFPTFRSMLEADLRTAFEAANDLGHFYLLMERMGYEVRHGSRLGFRLRGQERYMVPERKNPLFSEDNIRAAIYGNLEAVEAGLKPVAPYRAPYIPYKKHPKYTGFMALYAHYLHVLGMIGQRRYPPRMTPHLKAEVMRFEEYREQFAFLRENGITGAEALTAFRIRTETELLTLTKRRTILNVRKKREPPTDDEALARLYNDIAEVNRTIRGLRKKLKLCDAIENVTPRMEKDLQNLEMKEMTKHDRRR